jgi:hypothetical protein
MREASTFKVGRLSCTREFPFWKIWSVNLRWNFILNNFYLILHAVWDKDEREIALCVADSVLGWNMCGIYVYIVQENNFLQFSNIEIFSSKKIYSLKSLNGIIQVKSQTIQKVPFCCSFWDESVQRNLTHNGTIIREFHKHCLCVNISCL